MVLVLGMDTILVSHPDLYRSGCEKNIQYKVLKRRLNSSHAYMPHI